MAIESIKAGHSTGFEDHFCAYRVLTRLAREDVIDEASAGSAKRDAANSVVLRWAQLGA